MSVQEMKPIKEGKVREIYDNGDTMTVSYTHLKNNTRILINWWFQVNIAKTWMHDIRTFAMRCV